MSVSTLALVAESWRRTCVIGHRGSASTHPENTIPAFEEGIGCGADAVECDVHLSLDGQITVLHDESLDRTTGLKGLVAEAHSHTLKAAGVPFLSEISRTTKDRAILVVELKRGENLERKVTDHLHGEGMVDQAILFSFEAGYLSAIDRINPRLFTVFLIGHLLDPNNLDPLFDQVTQIGAEGIGTDYRNCPVELVKQAHQRGLPVFVWTVPPGQEVERLIELNVNFIITDHPRQVVEGLRSLPKRP